MLRWLWTGTANKYPALDGIVEICSGAKNTTTGWLLGVEVKCGAGHLSSETSNHFVVRIAPDPRWDQLPFPLLLVYVEYPSGRCYWQEYSPAVVRDRSSTVVIPKSNRLTGYSGGALKSLARRQPQIGGFPVASLPRIQLSRGEALPQLGRSAGHIKDEAWRFYSSWRGASLVAASYYRPLRVTRRGWDHITRQELSPTEVVRRLLLLPVAAAVLSSHHPRHRLRTVTRGDAQRDIFRQLVVASIPGRDDAIVSVLVEDFESVVTFRSVFEHRRDTLAREGAEEGI